MILEYDSDLGYDSWWVLSNFCGALEEINKISCNTNQGQNRLKTNQKPGLWARNGQSEPGIHTEFLSPSKCSHSCIFSCFLTPLSHFSSSPVMVIRWSIPDQNIFIQGLTLMTQSPGGIMGPGRWLDHDKSWKMENLLTHNKSPFYCPERVKNHPWRW